MDQALPKFTTKYGVLEVKEYRPTRGKVFDFPTAGVTFTVTFTPDGSLSISGQPIGFIQAVRSFRETQTSKEQYEDDRSKVARMTDRGTYIDQSTYVDEAGKVLTEQEAKKLFKQGQKPILQTNPVYNATNIPGKYAEKLTQQAAANDYGCIYSPSGTSPARLTDSPGRAITDIGETIRQEFETVALTLTEPYTYLGSITWGYTAISSMNDSTNIKLNLGPVEQGSEHGPTAEFKQAARLWNQQQVFDFLGDKIMVRVQIPPCCL